MSNKGLFSLLITAFCFSSSIIIAYLSIDGFFGGYGGIASIAYYIVLNLFALISIENIGRNSKEKRGRVW
jgi:hypothetical protein